MPIIPHVWALPWWKKIRIYLAGIDALDGYEAQRREMILRRWIARKRDK